MANELLVTPASIALSTKRLEKAGLIEKKVDENNLRCKKIYITKKGINLSAKCRKIFDDFDKKMFDGINEDELQYLKEILDRILLNLENIDSEKEYSKCSMTGLMQILKSKKKR
nr:hypothetical protein [Clostridium sp. BJN0001]